MKYQLLAHSMPRAVAGLEAEGALRLPRNAATWSQQCAVRHAFSPAADGSRTCVLRVPARSGLARFTTSVIHPGFPGCR